MAVLYDESHGEPKFEEYYSALNRYLSNIGERIDVLGSAPIDPDKLKGYAVFVISFPQKGFTKEEIETLNNYVSEGGGVFLVAEEGDFNHFKERLNSISKKFGITFNDDEVLDPTDKIGDYYSIIHTFKDHPVTQGVDKFVLYGGCSLNISGDAMAVATGDNDTYSTEEYYKGGDYPPVLAVVEHGKGRVACIGDGSLFRNNFINEFNNKQLALNLFRWLSGSDVEEEDDREEVLKAIGELEEKYDELNVLRDAGKLSEEEYRTLAEEYGQVFEHLERKLKGE